MQMLRHIHMDGDVGVDVDLDKDRYIGVDIASPEGG